jgi:hypothetical protein
MGVAVDDGGHHDILLVVMPAKAGIRYALSARSALSAISSIGGYWIARFRGQ